jgi:outer membrane lipoprotein-sorting protein
VVDITEKGEALATTHTQAAADEAPVSAATMRMLRTLEAFNKDVKTVHATFDQVRVDEVLMDTVRSPGELWFEKPARFRCDYSQPQPMITLVTDNTLYSYLPNQKQVEFIKFASDQERNQQLHHLLIAFSFDADALAAQYEIRSSEDDPELQKELAQAGLARDKKVIFQIKPRPAYQDNSPFKVMKVTVDKASHLPEKIWYKDEADAREKGYK